MKNSLTFINCLVEMGDIVAGNGFLMVAYYVWKLLWEIDILSVFSGNYLLLRSPAASLLEVFVRYPICRREYSDEGERGP